VGGGASQNMGAARGMAGFRWNNSQKKASLGGAEDASAHPHRKEKTSKVDRRVVNGRGYSVKPSRGTPSAIFKPSYSIWHLEGLGRPDLPLTMGGGRPWGPVSAGLLKIQVHSRTRSACEGPNSQSGTFADSGPGFSGPRSIRQIHKQKAFRGA